MEEVLQFVASGPAYHSLHQIAQIVARDGASRPYLRCGSPLVWVRTTGTSSVALLRRLFYDSTMAFVNTTLTYHYDDGKRPFLYARPRTSKDPHQQDFGGSPDLVRVKIHDGRQQDHLTLDRNAFELVQHPTSLSTQEFYSNQMQVVETTYYKEIEDLIKKTTGASVVFCFHHQTRNGKKVGDAFSTKQYATDVHTDTSPSDAEKTFFDALKGAQEAGLDEEPLRRGRFLFINAWRNIADSPIQDNHLALCDESSLVRPDDYIPYDYFEEGYGGTHYYLASRNKDQHRWYYFPEMRKDEVILFKQYDSDPTKQGRMCFHAAFSDPTAPSDGAPRESIEVRCVAFFPDHHPNTCPTGDGVVRVASSLILQQVDYVHEWPRVARWWFQDLVKREKFDELLDDLIKDKDNLAGLKNADAGLKKAVRSMVTAQGFQEHCEKSLSGLK